VVSHKSIRVFNKHDLYSCVLYRTDEAEQVRIFVADLRNAKHAVESYSLDRESDERW